MWQEVGGSIVTFRDECEGGEDLVHMSVNGMHANGEKLMEKLG